MKKAISTNITVEYEDSGKGRPVVLLHGFPFAHEMWRPQISALSSNYRVIAPDLRGFGGTGDAASSIEQMADDVKALLDALDVRAGVTIGGISMGGYVALAFARKYEAYLDAIILADTRAEPDDEEAQANRDAMIALAESKEASAVLEKMLPDLISEKARKSRKDLVAEMQKLAAQQNPKGVIAALKAMKERPDSVSNLVSISVPALVLVGSEDTLPTIKSAKVLHDGIPEVELVILNGAGHLSNWEDPPQFNAAVEKFLGNLE